jgi:hypothetical protein
MVFIFLTRLPFGFAQGEPCVAEKIFFFWMRTQLSLSYLAGPPFGRLRTGRPRLQKTNSLWVRTMPRLSCSNLAGPPAPTTEDQLPVDADDGRVSPALWIRTDSGEPVEP